MKKFVLLLAGLLALVIVRSGDAQIVNSGGNSSINLPLNLGPDKFIVASTGEIQINVVNTAAPTGTDCDAAGETGKYFWDSTNDNLYVCSGASGWRKIATAAP